MMRKLSLIGIMTILLAFMGTKVGFAADLDDYEYKDRSYIDRTLDDFERRTGKRFNQRHNENFDRVPEKHAYKKHPDYKYNRPRHNRYRGEWQDYCLPKHKIRRRLIKRGWHDFHNLNSGPRRIRLLATNFNGRRFKIVVNRCNGRVIRRVPMRKYWGWDR